MNKLFSTFKTFFSRFVRLGIGRLPEWQRAAIQTFYAGSKYGFTYCTQTESHVALALGGGASKGFAHIGTY